MAEMHFGSDVPNSAPGSVHSRKHFVGPGGEFDYLSEAFQTLPDEPTQHHDIYLTDDITDPGHVPAAPNVSVHLQGHIVTLTTLTDNDDTDTGLLGPVQFESVYNAVWENGTLIYDPGEDPGPATNTLFFTRGTDDSCLLRNIVTKAHDYGNGASGISIRHDTWPRLVNCVGVAGNGGSEDGYQCYGIKVIHNAHPKLYGCEGYANNIASNGTSAGFLIEDSSTPELNHCTGVHGATFGGLGFKLIDQAAPTMNNCNGRYPRASAFYGATGTDSVDVLADPFPWGLYETPVWRGGWDDAAFLETINFKIVTPGAGGSTLDIQKSNGATIATGAPLDVGAEERVHFDFTYVPFFSGGSTMEFLATDESAVYNVRWNIGHTKGGCHALELDTTGEARINGGTFTTGPDSPAGNITTNAMNGKNWVINGAVFRSFRDNSQSLTAGSSTAGDDPVFNCALPGGTTNLTPQ